MGEYTVQSGDTLSGLAAKNGMTVKELKACNNLTDDKIFIGQKMRFSSTEINNNEISVTSDVSSKEPDRQKHIELRHNPDHVVVSGDNLSKIAAKYGVEVISIQKLNSIKDGDVLALGRTLKIPVAKIPKNIRNLEDVSKALMVSKDFIKQMKTIEDGINPKTGKVYTEKEFHNEVYIDGAGVRTIGIGHAMRPGDKENLSDKEVLELYAKDMLKMETHLEEKFGAQAYKNLPNGIREALLDMVFNKGDEILNDKLVWCIKNGKYEAAINQMTEVKTKTTQKELSGLCKRRLFDISRAMKDFGENIPKSNLNTAQELYNKGVNLLKQECIAGNLNYENILAGYNKDIEAFFGDKLKYFNAK